MRGTADWILRKGGEIERLLKIFLVIFFFFYSMGRRFERKRNFQAYFLHLKNFPQKEANVN